MDSDPNKNDEATPKFANHEEPPLIIGAPREELHNQTYARVKQLVTRSFMSFFTWQNIFTAVIAVATVSQYFINKHLWEVSKISADAAKVAADAARNTSDLTRRTTAATSAAICTPVLNHRDRLPNVYFAVTCEQQKVEATLIRGDFEVHMRDLQTNRTVGTGQKFSLKGQIIHPGRTSQAIDFVARDYSDQKFYSLHQAIVVKGFMEYNDGFDRNISVEFCLTVLRFRSSNGRYNGTYLADCQQAETTIRQYREADNNPQR